MLYALLREIVGFSKEFPDTFELRYETAHGKYNEIAIIPKVGTPASFHKLVSDFICKRRKQNEPRSTEETIHSEEESIIMYKIFDYYCVARQDILLTTIGISQLT